MAPKFVGRYEHSLDAKGRIILPARFRPHFDTAAYVSKYKERCLALWTPEAFEAETEKMQPLFDRSAADRQLVRAWSSGTAEVELDRQGRVAIPAYLRQYASLELETPVLVHGVITHIEIWDLGLWEVHGAPGDSELAEPGSSPQLVGAASGAPEA